MSRRYWLPVLAMACAILVLAALALLSQPTSARSLTSDTTPKSRLAMAQAETGYPYRFGRSQGPVSKRPQGTAPQTGTQPNDVGSCWALASSPNPGSSLNALQSVAAISPNDIWAVGSYCSSDCNTDSEVDSTLIEHFDGRNWGVVPSPNVGADMNTLVGVFAISTKNAWAVGYYFDDNVGHFHTLIEHYDGRAWNIVSSPNPGPLNNYMYSVSAISPNDVWAVGNYRAYQGGPFISLTVHYDGTSWSVVPNPNPGLARDQLVSVVALAPNDVWAVGNACDTGDCFGGIGRTLTEHWDGSSWSVVPSPNAGAGFNLFNAVSASKPNDVWAVGFYCVDADCNTAQPLIEHYDGTAWHVASDPIPGSLSSQYEGVLAVSANDVWASGSFSSDGSTWTNLMAHYDGRSWSLVPISSPGAFNNDLWGLVSIGRNNVWAVGDYDNGENEPLGRTQVRHYDGPCN